MTDKEYIKPELRSLSSFIADIKKTGLARNYHFMVDITIPNQLRVGEFKEALGKTADQEMLQKISMLCSSVQMPGVNIITAEHRTFSEKRDVPYEKLYDDCAMNFYVDSQMWVRYFFDVWINSIKLQGTKTFNFYDNYVTNIDIYAFTSNHQNSYVLSLKEAYPKVLSPINFDAASKDVVQQQVSFSYHTWESRRMTVVDFKRTNGILDGLFAGNPIYDGIMVFVDKYGEILENIDESINKVERVKGELGRIVNTAKSLPSLSRAKIGRIDDLRRI